MKKKRRGPIPYVHDTFPLFELALVKGMVEHADGTAYFGSLGAYTHWKLRCIELGWVVLNVDQYEVTDKGQEVYERFELNTLPRVKGRRAYLWRWSAQRELWGATP